MWLRMIAGGKNGILAVDDIFCDYTIRIRNSGFRSEKFGFSTNDVQILLRRTYLVNDSCLRIEIVAHSFGGEILLTILEFWELP